MSITMTTVILFAVFGVLLFLGVPISISIVASSIVTAMSTLSWDQITFITMQKMNSGVESFSLLAVPLFILAGNIMNNGGIAKTPGQLCPAVRRQNSRLYGAGQYSGQYAVWRAVRFFRRRCVRHGRLHLARSRRMNGYDPAYCRRCQHCLCPHGPADSRRPAHFIVYSTVAGGVSISTLFMAGYIPGILMGLCCMVVAFIGAKKAGMNGLPAWTGSQSVLKVPFGTRFQSLLLIVIVIGGIVAGVFTATEGAGICGAVLPDPLHLLQRASTVQNLS